MAGWLTDALRGKFETPRERIDRESLDELLGLADIGTPSVSGSGTFSLSGPSTQSSLRESGMPAIPEYLGRSEEEEAAMQLAMEKLAREQAAAKYNQEYGGRGLWGLGKMLLGKHRADEEFPAYVETEMGGLQSARELLDAQEERKWKQEMLKDEYGLLGQIYTQDRTQAAQDARQEDQQAHINAGRERVTYHDPSGIGVVNIWEDRQGRQYDEYGERVYGFANETPWTAGTDGSTKQPTAAQANLDKENLQADLSINPTMEKFRQVFFTDPELLKAATGVLDLDTYISQLGLAGEDNEFYNAAQAVQVGLAGLNFEGVAPIIELAGANPTDKEWENAFKAVGTFRNNPPAILNWFEWDFLPMLESKARGAGQRSSEEIDTIVNEFRGMIKQAKAIHGVGQEDNVYGRFNELTVEEVGQLTPEIRRAYIRFMEAQEQ